MGMNVPGYLGIRKDISVKHLVSTSRRPGCMVWRCSVFFRVVILIVLQCRSFGDLTSLNSEEYNSNHFQHVYVSNLMILFKLLLPFCRFFFDPF